jgi:MFS transporter
MTIPDDVEGATQARRKWCFGVLNEKSTDEVPGSVVLLSKTSTQNAPLGLNNIPARTSQSSLPPQFLTPHSRQSSRSSLSRTSRPPPKKKTADGKIILNPQPEESANDPLNWPFWKRNAALLSLGFYCCIGGGITPLLAAGFQNVADTFHVPIPRVALTTGLYMMGLGIGGVFMSPTAIIFGKRPVYLITAVLFILSAVWCALSPSYGSLVAARIFQGIAVSPVEVLPSATVAEIFFLHERAFRLGIYTLLLLSGKNLIPLISAVIIQEKGWRWVFW